MADSAVPAPEPANSPPATPPKPPSESPKAPSSPAEQSPKPSTPPEVKTIGKEVIVEPTPPPPSPVKTAVIEDIPSKAAPAPTETVIVRDVPEKSAETVHVVEAAKEKHTSDAAAETTSVETVIIDGAKKKAVIFDEPAKSIIEPAPIKTIAVEHVPIPPSDEPVPPKKTVVLGSVPAALTLPAPVKEVIVKPTQDAVPAKIVEVIPVTRPADVVAVKPVVDGVTPRRATTEIIKVAEVEPVPKRTFTLPTGQPVTVVPIAPAVVQPVATASEMASKPTRPVLLETVSKPAMPVIVESAKSRETIPTISTLPAPTQTTTIVQQQLSNKNDLAALKDSSTETISRAQKNDRLTQRIVETTTTTTSPTGRLIERTVATPVEEIDLIEKKRPGRWKRFWLFRCLKCKMLQRKISTGSVKRTAVILEKHL